MDMTMITNFISQIGFPIAAFLLMFKFATDTQKQHQEETEKWTTALNNNTAAINQLAAKLANYEKSAD